MRSSPSSGSLFCTKTTHCAPFAPPSRPVRRSRSINDELVRDYGLGLNTRTGINTGEVVGAGANSTGSTLATGDMVNVAARLEARAQPGEIVIGAATHRLVRDAITAEELPPLELKGKSEPVAAFRLVDVAPDAPGLLRRFESPIVGRSSSWQSSSNPSTRRSSTHACRVAILLGEAGAGKSRLSHELAAVVGERGSAAGGTVRSVRGGDHLLPARDHAEAARRDRGRGQP